MKIFLKKKYFKLIFTVGLLCLSSCSSNGTSRNQIIDADYHTVVWLNYDNSILYIDDKVEDGTVPVYNGETPYKPGTNSYNYAFTGWSPNVVEAYSDAAYVAQFSICYQLSITSNDLNRGTVSIISGRGIPNETITIEAFPKENHFFDGWYGGSTLISREQRYSFVMPSNNYSLSAKFLTQDEKNKKDFAIIPEINNTDKTITYGLYPQKNINDSLLLSSLNALTVPEANGWYLYNNEYYAKTIAKPYDSNYVFDNGTTIVSGETYWFKCEPITWKILENSNGQYYLLSSLLLDTHRFDDDSQNYAESELRTWLNNEFYNSAFALGDSYIEITNVDNSAVTTDDEYNSNVCDDTQDKVFPPSYKDYLEHNFGFNSNRGNVKSRECKTTDWSRANGARYMTNQSYLYNGYYCSRSPTSFSTTYIWTIDPCGAILSMLGEDCGEYYQPNYGVRPAITLSIPTSVTV